MHRWLVGAAAGCVVAVCGFGCGEQKVASRERADAERRLLREEAAEKPEAEAPGDKGKTTPHWRISPICIDAGHGGRDSGVVAEGDILEKDVTLDIARRVRKALEAAGATVVMTRDGDTFVSLASRTAICNTAGADLFLSIHANGFYDDDVRGFEIYYLGTRSSPEAGSAAEAIRSALSAALDTRDRGVRRAEFTVLAWTKCPAVLVEVGYLTNPQERERLTDDAYRQKIADAIAAGLVEFGTEPAAPPTEEAQ
jgi:N-acetylmuramoyl-L-alanine amidase